MPFGALVIYKATKRQQAKRMKFDPTSVYGIFVDFHLHPGYTHSKDHPVIDLDQLRDINLESDCISVPRVREVIAMDLIKFPLRERRLAYIDSLLADIDRENDENDDDDNDVASIHPDSSEEASLGNETDAESVNSKCPRPAMSEDEWRKECEDFFGEIDEDFQNPIVPRPGTRPPALCNGPPQRPPDIALVAWNRMGHRAKHRAARLHEHGAPAVGHGELHDRLFMTLPAREIPVVVAPAIRSGGASKRLTNRILMKYCCGENSRLCNERSNAKGCVTVCLAITSDLITPEGLDYAMQELERAHADGFNIALWASLPCTARTPWFRPNQKFTGARAKNAVHPATFNKLMDNFMILAERVVAPNGDLYWEWPTHRKLWVCRT